ncbi:MAG: DsbE family thiol:disulfide interchange protein [Burkholderiales bacterium]|nr:DsbE family thiol:disulfide interchange protein [Burkholderiales bacterium]
MKRFLIPLALFMVLAVFLALGLNRNPSEVPSPLVGKPAPMFTLPRLDADPQAPAGTANASFSPKDMVGKVWLLNVWASWCVSCRQEHPVLVDFAKLNIAPLIGLDYKDQRADAKGWLAKFGDPYTLSVVDADGRVGIDYGVYGVPETYVIDKAGLIRFKQIGPVTNEILQTKILPLVKELQR